MISLLIFKMAENSLRVLTWETKGRITGYKFSRQSKAFIHEMDYLILFSSLIAVGFSFRQVFCFISIFICLAVEVSRFFKCWPTECSECSE